MCLVQQQRKLQQEKLKSNFKSAISSFNTIEQVRPASVWKIGMVYCLIAPAGSPTPAVQAPQVSEWSNPPQQLWIRELYL